MAKYNTQKEGFVSIRNEKNDIIAFLYYDQPTRKNVIYSCTPADTDEISKMISGRSLTLAQMENNDTPPDTNNGE